MLKIINSIFVVSGALFVLSILIHKLYISKQKDMMKASHFVAGMAIFMGIYILSGLVLTFIIPNIIYKIVVFVFAMSPFLIGKFANYKFEKIYSLIQVFCVLMSIAFILIRS